MRRGERAVYVFGPPGVGKTTLVAATMRAEGAHEAHQHSHPVPHVVHVPIGWTELGRWRPPFGGTDALSYGIAPQVRDWLSVDPPRLLIAEGDRLASGDFFRLLTDVYDRVTLVYVRGDEVARQRAAERAARIGSKPQNEAWWKGRATKCLNLAADWSPLVIDAALPTAAQVDLLRTAATS